MTSNENSICAGSLLTTKSLLLSHYCFEAGTELTTIMRCDHKFIFQQFLLTNINDDTFTEAKIDNSGQRHLTKVRLIPVCIEILTLPFHKTYLMDIE